jgi:amyloid beta precursor protein binding protein 1
VRDVLENDAFEDDPAQTPILWYLALRAADSFFRQYGRWPGDFPIAQDDLPLLENESAMLAVDEKLLVEFLKQQCEELGVAHLFTHITEDAIDVVDDTEPPAAATFKLEAYARELVRGGGCELHVISAFIGGIASQEAVKVITHQYIPLNNTYIFNGICSCGSTYEL